MCAPLLIFLALAASAGQASEPKSRIRYAEPIQIQASNLPGSAGIQSARTPALLRFDAYGRRFELELESNDRLLRRLSSARRAELPPHDLYRGRLTGLPGSWVRLTRLPDGIYGAVWDGSEFYSLAPAHTLGEFMGGATPATSDQPLIHRASDVDMLGGPRFCAVFDPTGGSGKPITGLDQYKSLLRELPRNATTAAVATLELEVAMIADFEFFSAEVDPASALLNRLNVVDGIFSEQVGVAITATELKVFDDPADPFTTSDAGTLLDQVGRYRKVTPAIAATGLAHLVTGRSTRVRSQLGRSARRRGWFTMSVGAERFPDGGDAQRKLSIHAVQPIRWRQSWRHPPVFALANMWTSQLNSRLHGFRVTRAYRCRWSSTWSIGGHEPRTTPKSPSRHPPRPSPSSQSTWKAEAAHPATAASRVR